MKFAVQAPYTNRFDVASSKSFDEPTQTINVRKESTKQKTTTTVKQYRTRIKSNKMENNIKKTTIIHYFNPTIRGE